MNNSKELHLSASEVSELLSPPAIRERSKRIFDLTERGQTRFLYQAERLQWTVDFVIQTIKKNYPDLEIPFHSRWGHFRVGGVNRPKVFEAKARGALGTKADPLELARTKLDLVITSVLLDAGAGAGWSYSEIESGKSFGRSEGLGVASLHMFSAGAMSGDRKSLRADAQGLKSVTSTDLQAHFQVTEKNPLVGVQGRVQLLNNLGAAVQNSVLFPGGRPGNIIDSLAAKCGKEIPATEILRAVLEGFGSIWPGRLSVGKTNLGDVWIYPPMGVAGSFESLVPFHKLSQWMTYSLIEPIQEAGFKVTQVQGLTGLAEYRNGGLMVDADLIRLKDPEDSKVEWTPDSNLIIEWRALTIHLLDVIGGEVQRALGRTPENFPLAKVLEGGTWWAGRALAAEKRAGSVPPLNIKSDGTVF